MAHLLFRWKPHPLEDSEPEEPYHLSGVWHAVGAERRTNRPLAPPFLTQPPVAYMNALKMLLVAESVLCASVVAEALMDPENTTVFQLLFRFPMAVERAKCFPQHATIDLWHIEEQAHVRLTGNLPTAASAGFRRRPGIMSHFDG